MSTISYHKDPHNIVHLVLDRPGSPVNLMDTAFADEFSVTVERLLADDFAGVIIRSNKSTFFAGGDINLLYDTNDDNARVLYDMTMQLKQAMRRLENCGKPVVACLNGSALGGGFELALACHRRIAINDNRSQFGLPEVTLGLLPGAGGVTRLVRLLGVEAALPLLAQGQLFKAARAQELGLIHQLVDNEQALVDAALSWIAALPKDNAITQPYDAKGYRLPGGTPNQPKLGQKLPIMPAMIRRTTKGTLPAPEAVLACAVEGAQVDFDTACRIESRYFVSLARGQVSKNLINAFWYQLNAIKAGDNRPQSTAPRRFDKVGVLGAGMMGAGIAYACAIKGIEVVLKDVSLEAAERGKDYSRRLLDKRLAQGRITQEQHTEILTRITTATDVSALAGCQLVIEAVFEDRALKAQVTEEAEAVLGENAIVASNTSTLPITGLAGASKHPSQFIGMHFFSPVDKMPLVEIICGKQTDEATLAGVYDLAMQLGKTPIVVNDSRGFYTSRVFTTFVKEGISLLRDAPAATVENAAWLCGFAVGPLAVSDEVSLSLFDRIARQTRADLEAEGLPPALHPADAIIDQMLNKERQGKAAGQGFYDYPGAGDKRLWPGLTDFWEAAGSLPLEDIKERLLFVMALETVRCLDEGVLRSVGDANIGALFGLGFPQWTGGPLQYINQYGLPAFVKRARELATLYGERFEPPAGLLSLAKQGGRYE